MYMYIVSCTFTFMLQFTVDAGETSVADVIQFAISWIERGDYLPAVETIALALTEKQVLCIIATNYHELATFDYFDLTLYRSKPCEDITDAEHTAEVEKAEAARS